MDAAAPEGTYRVSQLAAEIREVLGVFPYLWVAGEVQRPRRYRTGHLYFELVEKGRSDRIEAKLDAVLFRGDGLRISRKLELAGIAVDDGQTLRMLVQVDFYPPHGRMQLIVRDVDTVSAVGAMAQRREETLRFLQESKLLRANATRDLSPVPLRVGLVTSEGSAAYNDFVKALEKSGYGFQIVLMHSSVQGAVAETEVAAAVRMLGDLHRTGRHPLDAIAIVRGGGSRADLQAFDGRDLAAQIARAPLPVLTGLGHEIDRAVADEVAHTSCTTPTAVAELLAQRVAQSDAACEQIAQRLARRAESMLATAQARVDVAAQALHRAELPVERRKGRLRELETRLQVAAERRVVQLADRVERMGRSLAEPSRRLLEQAERRCADAAGALGRESRRVLEQSEERIGGLERLVVQLGPQRTLERGFSITRAAAGKAVREHGEVEPGDVLTTELAAGRITSRVEPA